MFFAKVVRFATVVIAASLFLTSFALVQANAYMAPVSKLTQNTAVPDCMQVTTSYVYLENFGKEPAIQIHNTCAQDALISEVKLGFSIEKMKPVGHTPAVFGTIMHGDFFIISSNGNECNAEPAIPANKKAGRKSFFLKKGSSVVIGVPTNRYYSVAGTMAAEKTD
jgi:hypothetical protein